MNKFKIRRKILNLRKRKLNKNTRINIYKLFNFLKKKKLTGISVGGYYPVNYEIDDLEILKKFEEKNYKISLPVIKNNNEMDFYAWSSNNILKINKYGIPEPEENKIIYPDILLVPIVAFDDHLYRIGYGGGYYDRYIQKLIKKKKFLSIGLAASFQKIKKIPHNKYDKRLDVIFTEKHILI